MSKVPRLGYLVSHPIQYQAPLFRALARSEKIEFVALFGCDFGTGQTVDALFGQVVDFGVDLLSGYQYAFLPQAPGQPDIDRFLGLRTRELSAAWTHQEVDVLILHGWRTAMMWQAAAAGVWLHRPYLVRGDTSLPSSDLANPIRRRVRDLAVRTFLRRAAGVLAVGSANAAYYRRMGCPVDRVYRVPYSVDDDAVATEAARGKDERPAIRAALGIPDRAYLVIGVGKLVAQKRPFDILAALAAVPPEVHFLWVGSGSQRDPLLDEARRLGVGDRLHLAGFRPSPEVWRIMGAADLLVLPSEREQWGLVLNEAVTAGLPILASTECGGAPDLVVPGKTGEILPVRDVAAWAAAISRWCETNRNGFRGDPEEQRKVARRHSLAAVSARIEEVTLRLADERYPQ